MKKKECELHPLIEAFFKSTEEFSRMLKSLGKQGASGGEKIVHVILDLALAIDDKRPHAEVLKAADHLDTRGIDPNLLILFYRYWIQLSLDAKRLAEASMLVARVDGLISADTPPELVAIHLLGKACLAFQSGRQSCCIELSRQALKIMPTSSPRYQNFYSDWASVQANMDTFAEIETEHRRILEATQSDILRNWSAFIYLMHFVKTGHLGRLAELDMERLKKLPLHIQPEIDGLLALAAVLAGRPRENLPPSLAAVRELMAGRAERALELAREAVKQDAQFLYGMDFQDFNLIRCELALGRGEAACRLLRLRQERGNRHYLDNFFLARAEMLAGRADEAAARFAVAYRACEHYRALPRLDFELRMAGELSAAAAVQLMRSVLSGTGGPPGAAAMLVGPETETSGASDKDRLIGSSPAMAAVREAIDRASGLDLPVLITGETGTGKELVARAIHEKGPRVGEPFVAVNCGAITDSLLESELFGYERGAFTGADKTHQGFFETAGAGSVFLDEIGEISPRLQVSLLRVLETGEIRRVGSSASRKVSCRILAATNAPLEKLIGDGRFRQDLFYRLKRLEIVVPPLRERPEDIMALAEHFLTEGRTDGIRPSMNAELHQALTAHPWPGNVRELRNEMERMRLMNSDQLAYDIRNLDSRIVSAVPAPPAASTAPTAQKSNLPVRPPVGGLQHGRSVMRHLAQLRDLFRDHGSMTRAEAAVTLNVSPNTATKYLQQLLAERVIERVEPTASPRTHYFRLKTPPAAPTDS